MFGILSLTATLSRWERFLRTQVRAVNPRTVAADVRRRIALQRMGIRLLTSAATSRGFVGRENIVES